MTAPSAAPALTPAVREALASVVGQPLAVQVLKAKPGRRCTMRVAGPRGTAIAKVYASERAPVVAARVGALTGGPPPPTGPAPSGDADLVLPVVRLLDVDAHLVVLSDVPGVPLSRSVRAGDLDTARRAGAALGRWHAGWTGRPPAVLRTHTIERELDILLRRAAATDPAELGRAVEQAAADLDQAWDCTTTVHRDLYEEQVLVADRIGLIDLDDAAAGPPELDVGNLVAHLDLLGLQRSQPVAPVIDAVLDGYAQHGPRLDPDRLHQCRQLTRLRLACIHGEPRLVAPAAVLRSPQADGCRYCCS